ncbi:MAG TPA: thioesterase family protein [Jatrophihabitans sp.]|nr:thioesterase family protein [Jatrophihabitans sp.]
MNPVIDYGAVEPVEVYFDDLDAMGVVHNAKYGLLVERALAAYWTRHGWPFDPGAPHFAEIFFVVREFSIRYRRPIVGVGPVHVQFWIDAIGESSVDYAFRVASADGSVVHAEGRRAQVKIDRRTLRPSPLSEAIRDACRPLIAVPEAARLAS